MYTANKCDPPNSAESARPLSKKETTQPSNNTEPAQTSDNKEPAQPLNRAKPSQSLSASYQSHSDWRIPARYQLRHLIGAGSYGHVSEAYDTLEQRMVAIKKIHHVFEDLVDCKRTLREIAILNRLKHQNVVRIIDICIPSDPATFNVRSSIVVLLQM